MLNCQDLTLCLLLGGERKGLCAFKEKNCIGAVGSLPVQWELCLFYISYFRLVFCILSGSSKLLRWRDCMVDIVKWERRIDGAGQCGVASLKEWILAQVAWVAYIVHYS